MEAILCLGEWAGYLGLGSRYEVGVLTDIALGGGGDVIWRSKISRCIGLFSPSFCSGMSFFYDNSVIGRKLFRKEFSLGDLF